MNGYFSPNELSSLSFISIFDAINDSQMLALNKILEAAVYTKSPDWAYEKEWRVSTFKRPNDSGSFSDYKFNKEKLSAVYLGPLMLEKDRSEIINMIRNYRHAKIYDVSIGMSREFIFNEINMRLG